MDCSGLCSRFLLWPSVVHSMQMIQSMRSFICRVFCLLRGGEGGRVLEDESFIQMLLPPSSLVVFLQSFFFLRCALQIGGGQMLPGIWRDVAGDWLSPTVNNTLY
ncbi:hypothetical protein GDO78_017458 [Eleutherodactylus coqui]|uniref:Uncharacterized protein n=1 Tax=Eleutherodactylus coqui TaxID=57060 RepID=A0A8J6EPQ6_ELECQ|nr:hypothetical protein GDO78_017458 [Eleutherodactylus coqui]